MKPYPFFLLLLFFSTAVNAGVRDPQQNISGKMIFGSQPFSSGGSGKSAFNSGEYIYGRFELNGATLKDAFKLKVEKDKSLYLTTSVTIFRNGNQVDYNDHNYVLLKEEDLNASSFNFDVMPQPSSATTLYSITNDFVAGYFTPLSNLIVNIKLKPGKYSVVVRFYNQAKDGWGKDLDSDKWPSIEEQFDYEFREDDISRIISDDKEVTRVVKENALRIDKLPDVFYNGATITDPAASNAKILGIIKRDMSNKTILKMAIEKTGTLWSIAKDEFNFPKYKYLYPHVWVAYKMNGKCYVSMVTLRQTYSGGGTWGQLEVAYTTGSDDKIIDCIKVR